MKACALGLTIMARIHGSLKRSPTRTTLVPWPWADGGVVVVVVVTVGRSSLRLSATVVSPWAAGLELPEPMGGTGRVVASGRGGAAEAGGWAGRESAWPAANGQDGAMLAVVFGSALATAVPAGRRGAAAAGSFGPCQWPRSLMMSFAVTLARAGRPAACAGRAGFAVADASSK